MHRFSRFQTPILAEKTGCESIPTRWVGPTSWMAFMSGAWTDVGSVRLQEFLIKILSGKNFWGCYFLAFFFFFFAPKVSCSIINMTTLILQGTHWHLNIHVWWHNFLPFLCSRILQIFQKFRFENADGLLSMGARYLNQTGHQIEKITWIINGSDLIIVG